MFVALAPGLDPGLGLALLSLPREQMLTRESTICTSEVENFTRGKDFFRPDSSTIPVRSDYDIIVL